MTTELALPHDRYFDPNPQQKEIALQLYNSVKDLPLVCPHGHVDPALFADENYRFPSPTQMLIVPDHYVFRMLYSQGISLGQLGIPRSASSNAADAPPSISDKSISDKSVSDEEVWQTFADHFYLFAGTPTGMWLTQELYEVFGVRQKLTGDSALDVYAQISERLASPNFTGRKLFEQFNIEVLCTTDPATSDLAQHKAIRESGWGGRILPTFRPDAVVNLDAAGWRDNIDALSDVSGIDVVDYGSYIEALEQRRAFFKEMGATATDHAALTPYTERLSDNDAAAIFERALRGESGTDDARRFTGHMLMEMARMSSEDGLVMQLHPGSFRNHNSRIYENYGPDMGADIPTATEFTRNLHPLLNAYGNHPNLTLILFMLDEATLSRELAPLAGHYPALRLGPPWWFFDSWNGMMRFRELVGETAGLYNTVGFNDDTRAFPSIPARHDLARRVDANWIANLVVRSVIDMEDAETMVRAAAYELAKAAYKLG